MIFFFLLRPFVSPQALGFILAPFFAAGLIAIVREKSWATAALVGGWWLTFALFYSANIYQADRFVLSYLPPLAVIAGLGLTWLLRPSPLSQRPDSLRLPVLGRPAPLALLGAVAAVSVAGLLLLAVRAVSDYRELYNGKEDYLHATQCLSETARAAPLGTTVFSFAATFTVEEYTGLDPRELFFETPDSARQALSQSTGSPRGYLLLPVQGFEEQWGRTPMGETYQYLRGNYTLNPVPCLGTSFTLYEIR
jgi:hypothetical protein